MKALCKKGLGFIGPGNEEAEEAFKRIKFGTLLMCEFVRSRNLDWFRLYWAAITLIFDNLPEELAERFPTKNNFEEAVRIEAGLYESVINFDGSITRKPGHINFSSMTQSEWEKYWGWFGDFVVKKILPGVSREDLWREIEAMI